MTTDSSSGRYKSSVAEIPAELRHLPQWHCWQLRDGVKIPVRIDGSPAKSNDPTTWTDFDSAAAAADRFSGLAFELTAPHTGVDLDNCLDEHGELRTWAIPIVLKFESVSYGEVSPSGTGIKFTTQARKPAGARCVKAFDGPKQQVECYDNRRFWAVTGNVYGNSHNIKDGQEAVDWLCREYLMESPQQPRLNDDQARLQKRAAAYIDKCSAAMTGQRNQSAFNIAGHLHGMVEDGRRLSEDQVREFVLVWNRRNPEPLRESEIATAVASSKVNGTPRPDKPGNLEGFTVVVHDQPTQERRTFAGESAEVLWPVALQPVEWLVTDILSADQPTIFGAKQKSLKTTLLADLAVALSSGFSWLGKFEVPDRQRVLLITGEASQKAAIRKIRRAAEKRNLRGADIGDNIRIETANFPTLPNLADCMAVQHSVEAHDISVVILDPLYMGLEGLNTSNLNEVGPAMRRFMQHCRPAKVIIAHHVKKTASYDDAPNLEDLSQAGIAEFAGNYWLMGRMSEYRGDGRHELAVRYGGRDEQFGLLKLDFDERAWTADFTNLLHHRQHQQQQKDNARVSELMNRIRRALERNGPEMSESAIADYCGTKSSRGPFQDAIEQMEVGEEITPVELKTRNNRICRGWKMSKDASQETPVP